MADKELKPDQRIKANCPECGPDRWATVKGRADRRWGDDDAGVWADAAYHLLQCQGCDEVYTQKVSTFSEHTNHRRLPDGGYEEYMVEEFTYWPPPSKRNRPDWFDQLRIVDNDFCDLFGSVYTALDNDLSVLAASGIRTVFDRATELLAIDPAISFEEKIAALMAQGRIGTHEQEDLSTMADAGSAAMHRGWKPSADQLDVMISTLERFVHHAFVHTAKAAYLRDKVPPKPARKKADTK
jgi:hypothetical protein